MRLIDADKLKIDMDCNIDFGGLDNRHMILGQIDNALTVEERKVGKWIKVTETEFGIGYQCSECGRFILTESIDGRKLEDFPYCHCGAEMRGDLDGSN